MLDLKSAIDVYVTFPRLHTIFENNLDPDLMKRLITDQDPIFYLQCICIDDKIMLLDCLWCVYTIMRLLA